MDNYLQFAGGASASGCYSSTVDGAIFRFNKAFGYERTNVDGDWGYDGVPGLYEYVGAAYAVYDIIPEGYENAVIKEMEINGKRRYILKGTSCPIARRYDSYMYRSEFDKLEREKKGIAAINCLIVPDDHEWIVEGLVHIEPEVFMDSSDPEMADYFAYGINRAQAMMIPISEKSDKGFKLNGPFADGTCAFVAVPAAEGWMAYADGVPLPITEVCGLMSVKVSGSVKELIFEYEPPGVAMGADISLIGVILLILYCTKSYKIIIGSLKK